jgi:hypothetical protein
VSPDTVVQLFSETLKADVAAILEAAQEGAGEAPGLLGLLVHDGAIARGPISGGSAKQIGAS